MATTTILILNHIVCHHGGVTVMRIEAPSSFQTPSLLEPMTLEDIVPGVQIGVSSKAPRAVYRRSTPPRSLPTCTCSGSSRCSIIQHSKLKGKDPVQVGEDQVVGLEDRFLARTESPPIGTGLFAS